MSTKRSSSKKYHPKKPLWFAGGLVLVIAIVAGLELTNTTHFFHSGPATSGKIPVLNTDKPSASIKKDDKTSSTANPSTADSTADTSVKSSNGGQNTGGQPGVSLQPPFGSFVSSHTLSLSDSSAVESACNTTAGASCTITFTNDDGVVKTLPTKTADGNGNIFWYWDIKTAGFTAGNWKITATATLNGQTQSITDQAPLKVQS